MKNISFAENKICTLPELEKMIRIWRLKSKTVAFTNGCFDILHAGHIQSLNEAASTADYLIVAVNSDASVRRLKGDGRPVNEVKNRALLLTSLVMVDAVIIFEEDTPLNLIKALLPDVLVKGGDYTPDQIAGAKEVIAAGGKIVINKILPGYSTTALIEKMKK